MAKSVNRNQSRYLREMRDFPTKVAKRLWKKFARRALRLRNKRGINGP
jgi:hypothetical protein